MTYQRTFIPKIAERFNDMGSYTFTEKDVIAMASICPFQVNAMGYSPFCDIFTEQEWMDLNYALDLATYYASGYFRHIISRINLAMEIPLEWY